VTLSKKSIEIDPGAMEGYKIAGWVNKIRGHQDAYLKMLFEQIST
jgi:hypothetical protein